jgi:D-alanyl-D-alanine carboxypeptidase/D-alanyl-D-alanine-endopeptidase (penicillin-binding protein 4)
MIASTAGCAEVYRSVTDPTAYFGAVFPQLLRSVGVSGKLLARRGAPPQNARPLTVARSKPLSQIVEDLNHFSNNFIAEQLLYALGGPRPYDRERGLGVLTDYLLELGVAASEIRLEDASGLSHENRLTARALTRLLRANLESVEVHPEFEVSLSVAGRSGTLRKRDFGVPDGRVRAKTGTLDGVSSLAGYLTTKRGRRLAFAILLNSMRDKQAALRIEDDLVRLLYQST